MTPKSNTSIPLMGAIAGILVTVALFRVLRAVLLPDLPNFSPVMAMAFCSGLFLPGALAWLLPIATIAVSDVALSVCLGYPAFDSGQLAAWACLVLGVAAGQWISRRQYLSASVLVLILITNSVIFYVVTNAISWVFEPAYPRGFGGLVQALTTGLPSYPPTWLFFRNSLVSDFLFVGLILIVRHIASGPSRNPIAA